jgi:preprotein translocase subunit SecA
LYFVDQFWCNYLEEIADIRDSIHFRRLGGQEPVFEFHKLSVGIFAGLLNKIDDAIMNKLNEIDIENDNPDSIFAGLKGPSSTWTYLVNDETFENILGISMIGNIALSVWAGLFWPITILIPLIRKMSRKRKEEKSK